MYLRNQALGLIVSAVLIYSHSAVCQDIQVGIYDNPVGESCGIVFQAGAVETLYVVVTSDAPVLLTGVRFAAPLPACALPNLVYLTDIRPFSATSGDSRTGVSIQFDNCQVTPIAALSILVFTTYESLPIDGNCEYPVLPDPNEPSGEVIVTDCFFDSLAAEGLSMVLSGCAAPPPASQLAPPDGATGIGVDPTLTWQGSQPNVCSPLLGCITTYDVYFGVTPDPPQVLWGHGWESWDPGPLDPNTTYYWRVFSRTILSGDGASSPEWSFTTAASIATQPSTWGRAKFLYRGDRDGK